MLKKDIKDIIFLKNVTKSFIDDFIMDSNHLGHCQLLISLINEDYFKCYDKKYNGALVNVMSTTKNIMTGPHKFLRLDMIYSLYSSTAADGFYIAYDNGVGSSIAHLSEIKFIKD